jgi:DNA helicase IV
MTWMPNPEDRPMIEEIYWRCSDDNLIRLRLPLGKTITSISLASLFSLVRPYLKSHGQDILDRVRQAEAAQAELEAEKNNARESLHEIFIQDFLNADNHYKNTYTNILSQDEYTTDKNSFVKNWLGNNIPGVADKPPLLPNDEQTEAIATFNGNILVTARAGSGKTLTLAYRAFFLIKHCQVAAGKVLLLAFNRSAALNIRRRIMLLLSGIDTSRFDQNMIEDEIKRLGIKLPHVLTFHALAYALAHPEEAILYDDRKSGDEVLSRQIQNIVDDQLRDPVSERNIRGIMLSHYKADWESFIEGGFDKDDRSFLAYRRSLPKQSLNGQFMKSFGEKLIADCLIENDVTYKYERSHWWKSVNYKPDFTVFANTTKGSESGVIIEYFGLKGEAKIFDNDP